MIDPLYAAIWLFRIAAVMLGIGVAVFVGAVIGWIRRLERGRRR